MIATLRFGLYAAMSMVLAACSTLVVEPSEMPMGVDNTVGRAIELPDKHRVLVTITSDLHAKLTQGESIQQDGRLRLLDRRG